MDKIEFDNDDKLDSPKVREMAKELNEIKVKRLEREKINALDDEIHTEKNKLKYREFIDKIPKPVTRGAKWVGKAVKGVASETSKHIQIKENNPYVKTSTRTNKRKVQYVDRGPAPSFSFSNAMGGANSFSNSLGGVASTRPKRSSKPHNPLGMSNNFGNFLRGDLLNPAQPVVKRKRKAKKKQVQTKYIILR
jgi:hypothetical protein